MKTLYLVRHGEASWQGDDYDVLTDRGMEQARIVGRALIERGVTPVRVFSGELKRHRHSAELAIESAAWRLSCEQDGRWAEMDYIDVVKAHDPRFQSHADLRTVAGDGPAGNEAFAALFRGSLDRWIEGGGTFIESFDEFCARVSDALDHAFAQLDEDQSGVVFTSGGPIGVVANRALEGTRSAWTKLLVSVNGGISKLLLLPDGALILVSLNEHAHMETTGILSY